MPTIVGIRFRKACKIYYFDPVETGVVKGDHAIVETARGVEFGEVVLGPRQVESTNNPLKPVLRKASEEDIQKVDQNVVREQEAFHICERRIKAHELPMNLVDVEFTYDVNKIIFYFTADGRIDFRELVKDLAGIFRTRIELHQIGVRDEAKMLGGIGCCGRPLCCATFLGDFEPVSIKMAKNQNLSLNPTKISGICGRLMCCLKYEDYLYSKGSRKFENPKDDAPKIGSTVACTLGEGKVVRVMRDERQASIQLTPDNIVTVDWDEIVDPTEAKEDKTAAAPEGCANCPGCGAADQAEGTPAEGNAEHGRENLRRERRNRNGERGENGSREGGRESNREGGRESNREGGRDNNGRRERRERTNGEQGEGRGDNGNRRERHNRNGEHGENFSREGNREGGRENTREGGRDNNGRRERRERTNGEQGEGRGDNGNRRERRNRNGGERNENGGSNGFRERNRDERHTNEDFKNGGEEQNGERRSRRDRHNRHRNQDQNGAGQVNQERGQAVLPNRNQPAGKHDTAVLFSLPPEELHVAAAVVDAAPVTPVAPAPAENLAHAEPVHVETPVHAEPVHAEPAHVETPVHVEPAHVETPVHVEPAHVETAPVVAPQLDQPAAPAVQAAPAPAEKSAPAYPHHESAPAYPHHVSVNRNREGQRPHHGGYRNPWGTPERPAAEAKSAVETKSVAPNPAPEAQPAAPAPEVKPAAPTQPEEPKP